MHEFFAGLEREVKQNSKKDRATEAVESWFPQHVTQRAYIYI